MNKQDKINIALSKLTIEEQELLGLIKKPKIPREKKHHKLKVMYMVGDGKGFKNEEGIITLDNPFLKIITDALDKLKTPKNKWFLCLTQENYKWNYKRKYISKLEYDLLCLVTDYSYDEKKATAFLKSNGYENSDLNHEYIGEIDDNGLLVSDTDYSFLAYKGYKLT